MKKILLILFVIFSLYGCGKPNQDLSTISIPYPADFTSLSPMVDISAHTEQVLRNMHRTLLTYNAETKDFELDMAEELNFDKNILYIKLKPNMLFHNNERIKASDVAYSFKRLAGHYPDFTSTNEIWVQLLNKEKSEITILDESSLTIKFNEDAISSSIYYAIADCFIVPESVSEAEQSKNPIGAGPYKFDNYIPGLQIEFSAFNDYYGTAPEITKIIFKLYSDATSTLLAFKNNDINYISLDSSSKDEIQNIEGTTIYSNLMNDINIMYLNFNVEPFNNIKIRKAINYGINKERIISLSTADIGKTTDTHLSKFMTNVYNENLKNTYDYNPEKAKEILNEYGYNENNPLILNLKTVAENNISNDMALLLKDELYNVNIEINIIPIPWEQYLPTVYLEKDYEATILQLFGYANPYEVMSSNVSTDVGNLPGFNNKQYDELMNRAYHELDEDKRNTYFKEAQQILVDNAVAVYLGDRGEQVALSKGYVGYEQYPFPFIDVSIIKIER
ncbi:MAG: ABC transporter substrate-binding protein [Lachnospirales bacterium]